MNLKKLESDHMERMLSRDIASQIPVHVTRKSYNEMLSHCIMRDKGRIKNFWGCALTGAAVHARFVKVSIFDRETGACVEYAPVSTLYCSACHAVPDTHGGGSVFSDEIMTLCM